MFLVVVGILTLYFYIGALFLTLGLFMIFQREYIIVLVGQDGDVPIMKGRKGKMRKIAERLNRAIKA